MGLSTIALAGLAGTALSAGVGAISGGNQAKADQQAANYNAAVAHNAAQFAKEQGVVEEQASQRKMAALLGRQKAGYAASGIDVGSGTPLDVYSETAEFGKLDQLTIRSNAARMAWKDTATAVLDEAEAANAKTAGATAEVGSLIGGASSVSDKWSKYQLAGVDPFAGIF